MTRLDTRPDFADNRPLWTRPGFVAAGLLIAVVVVVGLLIALLPGRSQTTTPAPTPGGADTATSAPGGTPSGSTAVPTAAPAGVTWRLFGQVALPFSTQAGPFKITSTTASGYAHTPTGALIAAAQLSTRSALDSGRAVYDPTVQQQFVPSADRDALLDALHAAPQEPAAPGELSQIAGFIYQSYSPDTAVIGLVGRSAGPNSFYVTTLTLQWRGGDWRMVAPPGGSWLSLSRAASDLTAVVTWGAR